MSALSPYAQWLGASVGTYRLEQLVEQSALGLVFLGHEQASAVAVRVRVPSLPAAQTHEVAATYQQALEREVAPLAMLQHPYILPLIDYGIHQGSPYLVWPHLVMRPLSARLSQSGPMDVVTVGRYLDQIATALEAAHEQGILHRNLSADCVFMQLDGQPVVADFAVRPLLELLGSDTRTRPFYGSLEACAPEQLLDGPIGRYTDVYALGALTYRLLTGQPVFSAETIDAFLQQHLYESVPSVLARRVGLPGALDRVLATALAKEPSARFASAGAFADAYHEIVSSGRGTRVPFAARGGSPRVNPLRRATNSTATRSRSSVSPISSASSVGSSVSSPFEDADLSMEAPAPTRDRPPAAPPSVSISSTDLRGRLATLTSRPSRIIATALIVLLFVSGGLFILDGGRLFPGVVSPSGTAEFVDSPNGLPGHSDALRLSARGLSAPPNGSRYLAWMLNQQTEHAVSLGALTGTGPTYSLTYNGDGGSGRPGTNLLGIGDKLEITIERDLVQAPIGAVVLKGSLPPHAAEHIDHLLVGFPDTPSKIGLLVGVLAQTRIVNAQATVLQNAEASHNMTAVQCAAQSILDVIEGTHGANYHLLPSACAAQNIAVIGDGYGLLAPTGAAAAQGSTETVGYLDGATDHASRAATADDATADIRTHAGHVEVAIANIRGWVTAADQVALKLLKTPADTAAAAELATLCDQAYHGVAGKTDQQINPIPGQAGAITAYEHAQFMATLTLTPHPDRTLTAP